MKITLLCLHYYHGNVYYLNGNELYVSRSREIRNHSESFSHGYSGSGPSQLALAILLELTDKETAIENYQRFKFDILSGIHENSFEIEVDVDEYIGAIPWKEPFLNESKK